MKKRMKTIIVASALLCILCTAFAGCSSPLNETKNSFGNESTGPIGESGSESEPVSKTVFSCGQDFSDGVAWVSYTSKSSDTLINNNGQILFQLGEDEYPVTDFVNGVALTSSRLIDKNNNTLFQFNETSPDGVRYISLNSLDDVFRGYTFVKMDINNFDTVETRIGVLDNKGNWYREPSTEMCQLLNRDRELVQVCCGIYFNNDPYSPFLYNLLTNEVSNDKEIIKTWKHDYLIKNSEGLAFVEGEERSGLHQEFTDSGAFYNVDGECVIDLSKYHIRTNSYGNGDYVPIFSGGYCALEIGGADYENFNHVTRYVIVIDSNGSEQFSPLNVDGKYSGGCEHVGPISNGLFATDIGYINVKGELVISKDDLDSADELGTFSDEGLAKVSKMFDKGIYYINADGEIAF